MLPLFLIYLLAVNVMTFLLFGLDKHKAKRGKWRISEATLLTMAVIGGSIGAWSCAPFPAKVITQESFRKFIQTLRDEFPIEVEKDSAQPVRIKGKTVIEIDRMADWLRETGRVLDTGPEGQLYIKCPWCEAHTMDGGAGETAYFPVGSNGYLGGGFKCLHAHCQDKTTSDFFEWARSRA